VIDFHALAMEMTIGVISVLRWAKGKLRAGPRSLQNRNILTPIQGINLLYSAHPLLTAT